MMEALKSCWTLLVGLAVACWDVAGLALVWSWDILHGLHVGAPRLEGLLVGVALAWVLLRRDKHPLLRVVSSPLKLVVDILDLAWDQVKEIVGDLWGTARGWSTGTLNWSWGKVKSGYGWVMESLTKVRDKLSRQKKDD